LRRGPVAGICAALRATSTEWSLILVCDLPYLTPEYLRYLIQTAQDSEQQVIVPWASDGFHPLAAAYHRTALPVYESLLSGECRKATGAYRQLRVRALTPEELKPFDFEGCLFKNMNSLRDYEEARSWWEGRRR
jgi:molybdopterin-guanine dinucleotide biosynthesis protein A